MYWKAICSLDTDAVTTILWNVLDTGASGTLSKKDILYSPLGESLMSYWSEFDVNADGAVTRSDLDAILENANHDTDSKPIPNPSLWP